MFPDTASDEPALTADEWLEGKDAGPKLMSLRPAGDGAASKTSKPKKGLAAIGKKVPKKAQDDEPVSILPL